jgi:excisionase family DNA binding protein
VLSNFWKCYALTSEASWKNCPASESEVRMISLNRQIFPVVLNNLISVKEAGEFSGYSLQYVRRLLRTDKLAGLKLGQQWLIQMESFETYLANAEGSKDHRFGPKYF